MADMIDMSSGVHGGFTRNPANISRKNRRENMSPTLQKELLETLKEIQDEIKEIKQHREMPVPFQENAMESALLGIADSLKQQHLRKQRREKERLKQELQISRSQNAKLIGRLTNMRKKLAKVTEQKNRTDKCFKKLCLECTESTPCESSMSSMTPSASFQTRSCCDCHRS